jgi:pyruvate dehydrogenase E1 component alpha subunit
LIECKTYRIGGHSRSDANAYRDKEEEKVWLKRDPILVAQKKLKTAGILNDADIERINVEIEREIESAVEYAEKSPLPASEECFDHLWA